MNERIKLLAEQAGIHDDVCSMCPIHELEKFALLIVKECADVATINNHQWESAGSYVLKHFGVEL